MAADIIARLKVDASNYDAGLSRANKKLVDFIKQNTTLNGIMGQGVSMLTKFAGGFAAAQVAMKAFNAIIMEGSQTTGDFVRNGLGAMNDTLGVVAKSIATLDFSAFKDGLMGVYNASIAVREAMDSLGDTLVGLSLAESDSMRSISEMRKVLSDSTASDEMKSVAVANAGKELEEFTKIAETAASKSRDVLLGEIGRNLGMELDVPLTKVKELIKEYASMSQTEQNAYRESLKALKREHSQLVENEKAAKTGTLTTTRAARERNGLVTESVRGSFESRNRVQLVASVLFEDYSSEELNGIVTQINEIEETSSKINRLQRAYNTGLKTTAQLTSGGGGGGGPQSEAQTLEFMEISPIELGRGIDNVVVPSMNELVALAKSYKEEMLAATNRDQYTNALAALQDIEKKMEVQPLALQTGLTLDETQIQQQLDELGDNLRLEINVSIKDNDDNIDRFSKSGKKLKGDWKDVAASISQAGSAMGQLDNKGLNVAGTIMQAVADVALGFAAALTSPAATETGPFGWIAAAVAGLATMTATIAAIKSQTSGSYASGGVVPGIPNGGIDSTFVYASPGELILNRAQQENLVSQLDAAEPGVATCYVKGENLITVINNTGRRRGYGELLFG